MTIDLQSISKKQFIRESQSMSEMVSYLDKFDINHDQILANAHKMVNKARSSSYNLSVEAFLNKYNLSTKEGVALMCLAESLLRVPDTKTADQLIQSTFKDTDWKQYISKDDAFYFNATSWGMLLTGKALEIGKKDKEQGANFLQNIFKKSSGTVIRKALRSAMHLIAIQFVMGQTIDKALGKAKKYEKLGYRFSYDILGEGARNKEQADTYFKSYKDAINRIGKHYSDKKSDDPVDKAGISIKLTALHPRYELLKKDRVYKELLPKIVELINTAKEYNIAVSIDAEEARRLDIELEIFRVIRLMPEFKGYNGIGFVLQAYQKRGFYIIDYLASLAKESDSVIPIRLVKGAYWDTEIKLAQINGAKHFPVYTNKYHSDVAYLACARKILDNSEEFFPQFATHNAHSIATIMEYGKGKKYEFQRLYGMGESLYEDVVKDIPCRIYAPIGQHKDLLAYLIRRLLENGANSSFASMLLDKNIEAEKVIEDPIAKVKIDGGKRNATIPLPSELYGSTRINSKGVDFGNLSEVTKIEEDLKKFEAKEWHFDNTSFTGKTEKIFNPSNQLELVGSVTQAKTANIANVIKKSEDAFKEWSNIDVQIRANILRNIADLLEENDAELMALCMKEAGKVLSDAIAEIREAVDFCRYYATQAESLMTSPINLPSPTGETNSLSLYPKGVFVCISPWNFPLAIFLGQILAALVTGNTVIAKPAEQTPLIASRTVQLCYEAGIPQDVLQLMPGKGSDLGPKLVKQEAVKGVCFTGSTATAKNIQRDLASRDDDIITLIAETGGQNCMIADSSTLPEQLCDDAILSAFSSAGQRCSALRILFLPEVIADNTIKLLSGAMDELEVGDPWSLSTDLGPVIDETAQKNLQRHADFLRKSKKAKLIAKLDIKKISKAGSYFAPQIWEINDLSILKKEHFGPILHVIRYKKGDNLEEKINNLKFGLTFGIHTRIHKQYQGIENRINAGNIYVNRNVTGAVVGTQPFGGEGLSGTGFKAGGPHYLLKFINERTLTINTSAIGGNVDLLMKT